MQSKSLVIARPFLGTEVEVTMDRPLGSMHPKYGFQYEVNYGYLDGITAPDGDDLDAYYLGVNVPLEKAKGTVIAIVHRENDDDDKLVVVPPGVTFTDDEILKQVAFHEKYFTSSIVRS